VLRLTQHERFKHQQAESIVSTVMVWAFEDGWYNGKEFEHEAVAFFDLQDGLKLCHLTT